MGVLISRESHISDGMGGEVINRAAIYTNAPASFHHYRIHKYVWLEVVSGGGGPGLGASEKAFFLFKQADWPVGCPDIRENDIITNTEGDWIVHHVRPYECTMQCDVEMVD